MKNILIIGASGSIAQLVTDLLLQDNTIHLTLFLRNAKKLKRDVSYKCQIIEADVINTDKLKTAIDGQDIVYVNLVGDLKQMVGNIVRAMDKSAGVRKIIFISSMGIYDTPLKPALEPYRKAADIIEASDLDYTILRPAWFSDTDEVDYETTKKGEPEKGSVISRKSLAALITEIIQSPEKFKRENLGVNKPNS